MAQETLVLPSVELTVVYERDEDGWWVAQIPEVPGAVSQGRTQEEAKEAAFVALALTLKVRRDGFLRHRGELPRETLKLAA